MEIKEIIEKIAEDPKQFNEIVENTFSESISHMAKYAKHLMTKPYSMLGGGAILGAGIGAATGHPEIGAAIGTPIIGDVVPWLVKRGVSGAKQDLLSAGKKAKEIGHTFVSNVKSKPTSLPKETAKALWTGVKSAATGLKSTYSNMTPDEKQGKSEILGVAKKLLPKKSRMSKVQKSFKDKVRAKRLRKKLGMR